MPHTTTRYRRVSLSEETMATLAEHLSRLDRLDGWTDEEERWRVEAALSEVVWRYQKLSEDE